jgi:hypothetical protein
MGHSEAEAAATEHIEKGGGQMGAVIKYGLEQLSPVSPTGLQRKLEESTQTYGKCIDKKARSVENNRFPAELIDN